MDPTARFAGTRTHVFAHWPTYLLLYGGGILLLTAPALLAALRGWWSLLLFGTAGMLVVAYFFGASLWAAYCQHDSGDFDRIFSLAQLRAEESFVHVNLGTRRIAVALARRLTTGRLTVLDVYNPAIVRSAAVARLRRGAALPPGDPRLVWRECAIDLLPLRDESVRVVSLPYVLSEFWQHGDRLRLLRELERILQPGGRLVFAERMRTQRNTLLGAWELLPQRYWQDLLREAGFEVLQAQETFDGVVTFLRAGKPIPSRGQQLPLGLDLVEGRRSQ